MAKTISTLKIWKEEYEAIVAKEKKIGATREIARRMLVWTEGFMHKTMSLEPTKEDRKVMQEIRELNLKNIFHHDKKEA